MIVYCIRYQAHARLPQQVTQASWSTVTGIIMYYIERKTYYYMTSENVFSDLADLLSNIL
jgi:hypothetical protein